ncbi:hypothetical protein M0Q50_10480 [bacterium]|jgi:hypothetical protein|nr:hypothetical protein [bacterium]
MGIISNESVTKTYEINELQLIQLIASDLKVPADEISISYKQVDVSNERFDKYSNYKVTGVIVTHKPNNFKK